MGMSTGGGGDGPRKILAEINVTPLVDVMLVLLIIFMVAAGVQTVEMRAEHDRTLEEAERILEEALAVQKKKKEPEHRKVEVDLPRVDSEEVNLSEVKKLKLQVDQKLVFKLGRTRIVDCLAISPEMASWIGAPEGKEAAQAEQAAFEPCLKALGEKLVDNQKLQDD